MLKFFVFATLLAFSSARWTGGDHSIWADYKKTFNLIYKTEVEELERLKCFVKNLELIEAFNAEEEAGGATYGLNEYSHMCHHEFKAHFGGGLMVSANRTKRYSATFHPEQAKEVAAKSVDWRKMGAVTHVKNQGQCGSCWAFSAVGCMEGVLFVKTGKLLDLSEEELVQCSGKEGNMGCNGGIMDKAFEWVAQNGGIDSESDYPYTSGTGLTGNCNSKKERKSVAQFTKHVDVPEDEHQMAAFLAKNGPISVAVDAGPKWQLYRGGVKTSCFAGQLDHGVLVVGFGEDKGIPYWIVKNSWGPMWGESGYIRIKRGNNCNGIKENACSAEP